MTTRIAQLLEALLDLLLQTLPLKLWGHDRYLTEHSRCCLLRWIPQSRGLDGRCLSLGVNVDAGFPVTQQGLTIPSSGSGKPCGCKSLRLADLATAPPLLTICLEPQPRLRSGRNPQLLKTWCSGLAHWTIAGGVGVLKLAGWGYAARWQRNEDSTCRQPSHQSAVGFQLLGAASGTRTNRVQMSQKCKLKRLETSL